MTGRPAALPVSALGPSAPGFLAFALGVLAVVFAVLNLDEVNVHWIVGVWRTPLIVVIVVCLLPGTLIGWIVASRRG